MSAAKKVKAITYTAVDEVAVREYELGPVGPSDIVVRTRYSMVSSGTELRVLGGHYGAAGHYPIIPGYSSVGEVIEVEKISGELFKEIKIVPMVDFSKLEEILVILKEDPLIKNMEEKD